MLESQSPSIARDMIDEQFTAEELILRDHLALDRTRLACISHNAGRLVRGAAVGTGRPL